MTTFLIAFIAFIAGVFFVTFMQYMLSDEDMYCDNCGDLIPDDVEPWHYSTGFSRHSHACDKCVNDGEILKND